MKHVSFLGAGSWGTALAILCANNGHQVTIWSKVKAETDMLKEHREHLERLPGVKLPDSIVIEEDLKRHVPIRMLLYGQSLLRLSVRRHRKQSLLSKIIRLL